MGKRGGAAASSGARKGSISSSPSAGSKSPKRSNSKKSDAKADGQTNSEYRTQIINGDDDGESKKEEGGNSRELGGSKSKVKDERLLRDADKMKAALYENLGEKEYDVADYYKETGIVQKIARNEYFGHATLAVISLNAIWIGVDTDRNPHKVLADANIEFQVMEHFFCVFFTFEWVVRFLAFANKIDCLRDGWFKFDSILVWMMIVETWMLPSLIGGEGGGMGDASILRLLRLLRLTRMARLMRSVPELVTLLKGMAVATRSVGSTLVLLVLFLYVFAIIFKQQSEGNEILEYYFATIPLSMWNLLLSGTLLDDITGVLNDIQGEKAELSAIFLVFVLISSFTVLNMLIGVLCEVVSAVAAAEKEEMVVKFVKQQLIGVLCNLDESGSGTISQDQFERFVNDPDSDPAFQELGVDKENLLSLVDVIFAAEEDLRVHSRASVLATPGGPQDDANPTLENQPSLGDQPHTVNITASQTSSAFFHRTSTSAWSKEPPPPVTLTFAEIIEMILNLRSSNTAMVKDVVELRKFIRKNQDQMMEAIERVEMTHEAMFEEVAGKQEEILSVVSSLASSIKSLEERLPVTPARQETKSPRKKPEKPQSKQETTEAEPPPPSGPRPAAPPEPHPESVPISERPPRSPVSPTKSEILS